MLLNSWGQRRFRGRASLRRHEAIAGMVFSMPAIALFLGFLALPIVQTVYYSFTSWDGIAAYWVGSANYQRLFSDPAFGRVIFNNAALIVSVPVATLLPLFVAFLLNEHVPGWRLFRSVYFLPTAISWVVIGIVAVRVFAANGPFTALVGAVIPNMAGTSLLGEDPGALLAVMLTFIWSVFGYNTIIFVTGMATLNREVYEAAKVDGAGAWALFVHVTVPLLMPFIELVFILTLITGFTELFTLIYIMTSGGPGFATTTLEFFVYETAFSNGAFGYAAAVGVVLLVVVLSISLLQLRVLGGRGE